MSSNSFSSSPGNSSSWTSAENKLFEKALVLYHEDTPDRWLKIARAIGGRSAEEVRNHYKELEEDLKRMERVPASYPYSRPSGSSS